jgi:hypothetical protein
MNSKTPENDAKKKAAEKPGPDDLHEQREKDQARDGVVREGRPPAQSLIERQRADWEGMGQSQAPSEPTSERASGEPVPSSKRDARSGRPTPGANAVPPRR